MTLNDLAEISVVQARHAEAEVLYQQATEVIEAALGPDHVDLAAHLAVVAAFYAEQGIYTEAEPRYERAVAIMEPVLGWAHPDLAVNLAALASVYYRQGLHAEAEPLYERSLAVPRARARAGQRAAGRDSRGVRETTAGNQPLGRSRGRSKRGHARSARRRRPSDGRGAPPAQAPGNRPDHLA